MQSSLKPKGPRLPLREQIVEITIFKELLFTFVKQLLGKDLKVPFLSNLCQDV
jgi:hypothetical protein